MNIPLNRLGIEWNPCQQGKGRIRFYNVETEKSDLSLRKSAGAVEAWWYDSKVDDLGLTFWLYHALLCALIDGVDRTLINTQLTSRVGKIRHHEANEFAVPLMHLPAYYPPQAPVAQ